MPSASVCLSLCCCRRGCGCGGCAGLVCGGGGAAAAAAAAAAGRGGGGGGGGQMTRLIIKIVGASCAGKRHTKRILYPQAVVAGTFKVTSNTPKACQLQIVLLRVKPKQEMEC